MTPWELDDIPLDCRHAIVNALTLWRGNDIPDFRKSTRVLHVGQADARYPGALKGQWVVRRIVRDGLIADGETLIQTLNIGDLARRIDGYAQAFDGFTAHAVNATYLEIVTTQRWNEYLRQHLPRLQEMTCGQLRGWAQYFYQQHHPPLFTATRLDGDHWLEIVTAFQQYVEDL